MKGPLALLAIALVAPLAIAFGVARPAEAVQLRISQESAPGASDFDLNTIGYITAFETQQTLAEFYGYQTPFAASFNGPIALTSNASHLFLVEAADGLGLFSVHDKRQDGSGGKAVTRFELLGDTASILVRDDPKDPATNNGTVFMAWQGWAACCTDGLAIASLENDWKMFVQFINFSNLDRWLALSETGSSLSLALDLQRRVRIEPVLDWNSTPPRSVPEPISALALLGVGTLGIIARSKQSSKL